MCITDTQQEGSDNMSKKELIDFLEERKKDTNEKLNEGFDPYYGIGSLDYLLNLALIELKKVSDVDDKSNK